MATTDPEPRPARAGRGSIFQRHRIATLVGVCGVLFAVVLVGVELLLGLVRDAPAPDTEFRYIKLAEHRPSMVGMVMPGDNDFTLEHKPYRLAVDADGFIEPARVHEDPELVLAFLGGSTTECMLVEEDRRFPYRAGRLIEERTGRRVNSYNCGMAGINSIHSLNLLLNKVLPLQPDAVAMMHNANDLIILLYEGGYWTENPAKRVIGRMPVEGAGALISKLARSTLPHLAKLWRDLRGPAPTPDPFRHLRGTKLVFDEAELQRKFRRNLRTFVGICRAQEVTPVLLTQANRLGEDPDEVILRHVTKIERDFGIDYQRYRGLWALFNDTIRALGREEGVVVVDLEAQVPKEGRYMYDLCHYNTVGSELAAGIIAEALIAQGVATAK